MGTNNNLGDKSDVKVNESVSVIIPYNKEFVQGKELLFAVRSWVKNCLFPFRIVVIGDREEWFGEELVFIESPGSSDNRQVDMLDKLKKVLASSDVTERFVWADANIYLINPIEMAHIELPKVTGILDMMKNGAVFPDNMQRTIQLLEKEGMPRQNFETRTPVLFEKARMQDLLEHYPEMGNGVLLSSLYFNSRKCAPHPVLLDWRTDSFLLPVVSQQPDEGVVRELTTRKVFLTNAASGYSPWLEKFLTERFPEQSCLEM